MSNPATILGLCIGREGTPDLTRQAFDEIELVEGKGIKGDKKFGKSTSRHVNLITQHSYDWFKASFKRELGRSHFRGSIGMARNADPDSAGSQFYFCLHAATTYHLNQGYCVFGRVSQGLEVMDQLRLGSKIIKARVLSKRAHDYKVERLPEKE